MPSWTNSAQPNTKRFLILSMILNIVMNYFWRHELFSLGQNLIYTIQQYKSIGLDTFFFIFTLMIDPIVVIVATFTLIIVVKNKKRAFVTVMFLLLNTYFVGLLKAFYADPRPFWDHKTIQSIGYYCPQQYGNPSGHSWFSVIIGFAIVIEFWGLGKRYQYFIISMALMIFVPMSRMYLGAHSLNQVVQGLFLGFLMVCFFKFCGLKHQIESYLRNFSTQANNKWIKLIIVMIVLYTLSFMINEDDINPYHRPIPDRWIRNIYNKCNRSVDTNKLNFMMLMVNSLLVSVSTGIGFGFKNIIKSKMGQVYLSGMWSVNQKGGFLVGHLKYYFVEVGHLVCGFTPAIILVSLFGTRHWMMLVFGNLGAFFSGYFYTSNTFKMLFDNKIILQKPKQQ